MTDIERAAFAPGEQPTDGTQAEGKDALAWKQDVSKEADDKEARAG